MRLRLVAASCLIATPAHAGEMEEDMLGEPMVEEEIELDQVEHEASAGYVASVTGAADAGGAAFGLATLGGDVAYTMSFGRERSQYEITIDAGAAVSRMEGTVDANGASTRLHLALGPAPVPIGNKDLAHAAPFPLTFELDHEGELAALPRLSDRPDVLRAPYLSQSIALATRVYMMEYAEDGIDEQQPWKEPGDRETGGAEAVPIRAALKLTGQDGTRLEGTGAVGFFAARTDFPVAATVDCFLGEHHVVQLDDGDFGSTDTFWLLRGAIDNPATGTGYEISWGFVVDQRAPAARERKRDHTGHGPMVGALGLFSDPRLTLGYGGQYRHDAYVTMAGEPATEDRMFVEGWWEPERTRLSARLFAARTKRELADGAEIAWTGGVELDARREVGLIAVGLHAEGGQSYYATLDGGAPTAELGARAALTLSRSARWVRGTR